MSAERWQIKLNVFRKKEGRPAHYQAFALEVDPEEYVLDAIERIWAFHDRSLVFRHACHHSTCGACGMLVNGAEKLTCITTIRSVTHDGGVVKVEPLRNFPVTSDLAVDMGVFYQNMERAQARQVIPVDGSLLPYEANHFPGNGFHHERLNDCIECGMCISACPSALTSDTYMGPAVMAAAQQTYQLTGEKSLLELVDCAEGVWRCHSGFECTAICPSNVDPAWRIMNMRRRVMGYRIKQLFGLK